VAFGGVGEVEFVPVPVPAVEDTGSYGAGLARHVTTAGVRVVEAGRSDRQDRRRQGKSDLRVPKTCATWAEALQSAVERSACARAGLGPTGGGMIFGLWA